MTTPIVGIVGGLGPESTIDYYRRILELWQKQHPATAPEILIDSLDVTRGIEMVPLLVKSETLAGLPILDSTELHVKAIVRRLTSLQHGASSTA